MPIPIIVWVGIGLAVLVVLFVLITGGFRWEDIAENLLFLGFGMIAGAIACIFILRAVPAAAMA